MKKLTISLVAALATFASLTAIADVTQVSSVIDSQINLADFKDAAVNEINDLVGDMTSVVAAVNSAGAVQVNTNANIDLTTVTPSEAGAYIYTPNSTNTFTLSAVNTGGTSVVTVVHVLRAAINVDGTTNGWVKIATDAQP